LKSSQVTSSKILIFCQIDFIFHDVIGGSNFAYELFLMLTVNYGWLGSSSGPHLKEALRK